MANPFQSPFDENTYGYAESLSTQHEEHEWVNSLAHKKTHRRALSDVGPQPFLLRPLPPQSSLSPSEYGSAVSSRSASPAVSYIAGDDSGQPLLTVSDAEYASMTMRVNRGAKGLNMVRVIKQASTAEVFSWVSLVIVVLLLICFGLFLLASQNDITARDGVFVFCPQSWSIAAVDTVISLVTSSVGWILVVLLGMALVQFETELKWMEAQRGGISLCDFDALSD
ncbi:hypothetical protein G7K_5918-t1 [Saitoella complicata NRRL Y-17804]|uniref:Uncharacterized protein n=1 Tax=Saitoella complicata (strain BCRC 22490 / CBS 7301 / JCM 7358 / NBRC 10748 / NRRL Y-17804) TaxID=698492 RepID=A0A0E9NPL9_SAICN|nr:hypothetical protein G7K_5918-t1 [Saitoella complicata NRRL Y-17804]